MKKEFIAVMIIPTGIGAKIGGHAGDATLPAHLLAGVCDTLIIHPNVVNAADLNEMPHNALYVEGSMLDRFLRGDIDLKLIRSNRILVVCNKMTPETINCVRAARMLLGMDIEIEKLNRPLTMTSQITQGVCGGDVTGMNTLISQCTFLKYDALAIHTEVEVPEDVSRRYLSDLIGINPWGGVEAIVSRRVSQELGVPVAHAPLDTDPKFNEVVPEPVSPELISVSMLFSVLKGLHKAPRIAHEYDKNTLDVNAVDVLVSPDCWGTPHQACLENNIPIIRVTDNTTSLPAPNDSKFIDVKNYLEATGMLVAIKKGITIN